MINEDSQSDIDRHNQTKPFQTFVISQYDWLKSIITPKRTSHVQYICHNNISHCLAFIQAAVEER